MKKFFGFGSSTPPPPPPPSRPPSPPAKPASPPPTPGPAKPEGAAPAAPAPSAAPSIVGRWKEPNGSDTTEFHADGTVTERPASGETIRGHYSLEGGRLKINLQGVDEEIVFDVTVRADALEMKDSEGNVTRYQKA